MAKKNGPVMVRKPVMVPGYSHHYTLDSSSLEGTIGDAIARLEALRAQFPDKNLILSWEQVQWEDYSELHVYEYRPETDEERAAREAEDNRQAEHIKERELAQLEALKKKYPNL